MINMVEKIVYVIILAWNQQESTRETLQSILKSDYLNIHVVVVDNASTDGTIAMLKEDFPEVKILSSEKNLGVSGGYNLGIKYAMNHYADYVLIANNDISVHIKLISNLVAGLEEDSDAGMAMPVIYHYFGNQKRFWCTGGYWRKFPLSIKLLNYNKLETRVHSLPKYIQFAPSCLLLLKRDLIEKVGLFDTTYYFYFDDWDYSERVRKSGFKIILIKDAIMWHKVSLSTQKSEKPRIWWEHMGWSATVFSTNYLNSIQQFFFLSWIVIRETIKGNYQRSKSIIKGIISYKRKMRINHN